MTVGRNAWFFLALPDNDAAAGVAARMRPTATVTAAHPSGRPWLLARLPEHQAALHDEGQNRLALIGTSAATPAQLARIGDDARTAADFTGISARFPGNYCVVGSLAGQVYAQGSAIGMRRVYHALIDGVQVVCDRSDVLAELGGLPLNQETLALRLTRGLPHPLPETTLWHGIQPVEPEDYIVVQPDGRGHETRTWWRRPEPGLSRVEGARRLREALEAAVYARATPGTPITADLSGGLDSTPLCYFAARTADGVIARTAYNDDPGGGQDLHWARTALRSMPGVREHVVFSTDDMPDFFGGLMETHDRLDMPGQALLAAPRMTHALADTAARGGRTYVTGLGGDQLFCGLDGFEHTLFRTRPLLALRRARASHIPRGKRFRDTVSELFDRRSYRDWLGAHLSELARRDGEIRRARLSDWSIIDPALPPWLSARAYESVLDTFRETVASARPLGADRAAHLELSVLRESARTTRGAAQLGSRAGVACESPLLDDQVAEAVLSVRREERATPVEWKPLVKDAMRGSLPEEFLRRTTKVGGSAQLVRGFAAHYGEIRTLCESSGLADSGLLDMDVFAEATRPDATSLPHELVNEALHVALFLRNQARSRATEYADA